MEKYYIAILFCGCMITVFARYAHTKLYFLRLIRAIAKCSKYERFFLYMVTEPLIDLYIALGVSTALLTIET